MSRNRIYGILLTAAVVAVAAFSLIVVLTLLRNANREVRHELALTRLEEYSLHINADEWHIIAEPGYLNASQQRIGDAEQQIEAILGDLQQNRDYNQVILPVKDSYLAYREAVKEETVLLAQGDYEAARQTDSNLVDPSYLRLEDAITDAAAFFSDLSARDEFRAYLGSAFTILASSLMIGFLIWRFDRLRQLNMTIETEKKLLKRMSLVDDLTGLYNRRGFMTLADQQLKTAHRERLKPIVLFADLDDMKWINDTKGHATGDQALISTANIFNNTFRTSDIIARLGGDEFVVLAMEAPGSDSDSLLFRLNRGLETFNSSSRLPFRLMWSVGMAEFDPNHPETVEELVSRADRRMYEQKQRKHAAG
jgi:diguanylate cyclase (GGDEF)-like protein